VPKILLVDIETAPKVAYVWRFWQENVSAKQVLEHGHIMSFAAKWLGEKVDIYQENRTDDDHDIIESLCILLDQADVVVAHNGNRFDIPQIKARALVHGLKPPSPFKTVDTYKVAKREFGFPSNSLEYLSIVLDLPVKKGGHKKFPGFELWLECLRKNEEAWKELKLYNIQDVYALEALYLRMRPWMSNHPNVSIYKDVGPAPVLGIKPQCPKCGSGSCQWRGYAFTATGQYHKYVCNDCGGWGRTRYMLNTKDETLLGNLVS
jgi:hypothetical protein